MAKKLKNGLPLNQASYYSVCALLHLLNRFPKHFNPRLPFSKQNLLACRALITWKLLREVKFNLHSMITMSIH